MALGVAFRDTNDLSFSRVSFVLTRFVVLRILGMVASPTISRAAYWVDSWYHAIYPIYRTVSNTRRTKSQNLNASRLIL